MLCFVGTATLRASARNDRVSQPRHLCAGGAATLSGFPDPRRACAPAVSASLAVAAMRAALFFQGVSLLIGMLSVPMFLRYLSPPDFLLWMIFTTIGGLTLQIESALQTVSVRRIAREVSVADLRAARREVRRAAMLYCALSLCVALLIVPSGYLFIVNQQTHAFSEFWHIAWLIFGCAYAFNFLFGPNNCLLLATNATDQFNYTNALTRLLNFCGSLMLLSLGYAVLGSAVSFALSVMVGCTLIWWQTRHRLTEAAGIDETSAKTDVIRPLADYVGADVLRFTLFTSVGYCLYRGGLLVAVPFFSSGQMSSYSLTLTALSVFTAIALIPNQTRLGVVVAAVVGDRPVDLHVQVAFGLLFATATFTVCFGVLVAAGPMLLEEIGSAVSLPTGPQLAMVFGAFLVESWIMVLVNILVIRKSYEFVVWYCIFAVIAFVLGMSVALSTGSLYVGLALVPALLQAMFALPAVFCACAKSCGQSWQRFALDLVEQGARMVSCRIA